MSASYITDSEGNVVYPKTLVKCVNKDGSTLEEYLNDVEDATLIKSTESGTDMVLTDSSDMNIQELHLFGKSEQKTTKGIQLLDFTKAKGGTNGGITYTQNGDGTFKRVGTATNTSGYDVWFLGSYITEITDKDVLVILEAGKQYFVKYCTVFMGTTFIAGGGGRIINVLESEYPEGIKVTGIRNPDVILNRTYNDVIYPIIAESSTAVEWEEYTGGQPSPNPDYPQEINSVENPTVNITGKNKVKEYLVNKTAKPYTTILNIDADLEANKEYSLSFIAPKGLWFYFNENLFAYDLKQATGEYQTVKLKTVATLSKNNATQFDKSLQKWIILKTDAKNTVIADFEKVQLEEGNVGTAYEEYKEIQSVQPTCELNGIDDVKDELIVRADGTGQLIQRLAEKIMNGSNITASASEQQEGSYLINMETVSDMLTGNYNVGSSTIVTNKGSGKEKNTIRFGANNKNVYLYLNENFAGKTATELREYFAENPFTIVYPLEEPIVTELSAEEVQKILALHTNKPNTTIWNDQNADMQITYVADTKSYIDKKFKELSDAIVASVNKE
ncbi:hypothetical protein [uncultured Eubacterium sp.]|uniref:hypothetical protein n=1 Tax=uncultured Eubacterium sp. TaxID=165185 RepID=UPI0025931839|nr:hypothetical protein [uncultured Eubacterium sp.]